MRASWARLPTEAELELAARRGKAGGRNLEDLQRFFDARQYYWALIGGVALTVAMKVLAIKNDSSRTFQDLADIRFLASLPGVDHEEIRHQFERHDLLDQYRELERTL